MDKKSHSYNPELWGGIECTINRIKNEYRDQLRFARHYTRTGDIDKIAELGIKTLRYPVLWEYHQPVTNKEIDWSWSERQLCSLHAKGINPVVGLVHHGSGPLYTDLLCDNFAEGLAAFAAQVASKFPWIEYYTPVNEPLTTARFSGLYGLWYPHHTSDISFSGMLLNELKAVVLAMRAIRKINPAAKLVQTEDLAKTYSTPYLQFQANFENERRWVTFDLLCGRVSADHVMWKYFLRLGVKEELLQFFLDNPCPPDIMGLNYYITSERFIDEQIHKYPPRTHGGNEIQVYADVEAIRVKHDNPYGLKVLLKEAWDRFHLPIAMTEAQLNCTREEQLKWLFEVYNICKGLKADGVEMVAVTAWSLFGAFGWNRLVASPKMKYETGVFDLRSGHLRPTALAGLVKSICRNQDYYHPVLAEKGWWHSSSRFLGTSATDTDLSSNEYTSPLVIIGKTGMLGNAFACICKERRITFCVLGREDIDIRNLFSIEKVLKQINPWAVINTTGFVKIDEAETDRAACYNINAFAPELLAMACQKMGLQFLTFSSGQVFDGSKQSAYDESDKVNPLNTYGKSKAFGELLVLKACPHAMIVRTGSFFGAWDKCNFITQVIENLSLNRKFPVANDIYISPTYLPDLVHACLDLIIDKEKGIWHMINKGRVSWAELAFIAAEKANLDAAQIISQSGSLMGWKAIRPKNSVLKSEKGILLPGLKNALTRYFHTMNQNQASDAGVLL